MRIILKIFVFVIISNLIVSCSSFVRFASGDSNTIINNNNNDNIEFTGKLFKGKASYYANKFNGRKTANGEIFSNKKFTAAHRSLPFGTRVLVTNLKNGKSVIVRINDRGPFVKGRIIDLSRAAAKQLDMIHAGVAEVEVKVLK